jgi:hypothetical protein
MRAEIKFIVMLDNSLYVVYKRLKETIKMNVNPDTTLYMCMQDITHQIPNIDTNGFWMFNFMSQIVLR